MLDSGQSYQEAAGMIEKYITIKAIKVTIHGWFSASDGVKWL